jgi:molecular chaperone DnaK
VTIAVYQGEREMAADNKNLGQFNLEGIPPAPRGVPQIEVTFDIDANGIVNVSAADKATGKEQAIRIEASGGLSDDDIEQMVKDAEANASADKERREQVEARNNAEALIHATEKSISENEDKIDAADKDSAEAAMAELKTALEGEDMDAINEKAQALSQAAMKIGEAVYQAQQAESEAAAASDAANDASDDGTVVDAEFEEVSENDSNDDNDEADSDQKAS